MSEIVSFYDWYLSQRTKPQKPINRDSWDQGNKTPNPKDIEEED